LRSKREKYIKESLKKENIFSESVEGRGGGCRRDQTKI
jgi:hypothetical protein